MRPSRTDCSRSPADLRSISSSAPSLVEAIRSPTGKGATWTVAPSNGSALTQAGSVTSIWTSWARLRGTSEGGGFEVDVVATLVPLRDPQQLLHLGALGREVLRQQAVLGQGLQELLRVAPAGLQQAGQEVHGGVPRHRGLGRAGHGRRGRVRGRNDHPGLPPVGGGV